VTGDGDPRPTHDPEIPRCAVLGLAKALWEQYLITSKKVLGGDFGHAF
jgi:hypothetical protein